MTEINPDLFWHGKDVGAFGPWRDRFEALKPPLYRLAVDWSTLQPTRDGPDRLDQAVRRLHARAAALPPVQRHPRHAARDPLPAAGRQRLRDDGRRLRRPRLGRGARPAAASATTSARARARSPTQGLEGYKKLVALAAGPGPARGRRHQLVEPVERAQRPVLHQPAARAVQGLARSRWRPPSTPSSRARCARELEPGQQLVVGELAGLKDARKYGTSISEFFDGLPDDVVCNAGVFAQHAYSKRGDAADDPGAVGALEEVLDRRACTRASRSGSPRAASAARTSATSARPRTRASAPTARPSTCRCAAGTTTRAWTPSSSTPSATTPSSRSGWPTPSSSKAWPAYDLFKAWGGDRKPDGPAPRYPGDCRA